LLVFGGSRGARHINDSMIGLAPRLLQADAVQILHVAGKSEAASVAERVGASLGDATGRYRVVDYIDTMGDAIAAADVIVARAGATSIAEITAIGRAAVLVPYPFATDDHQTLNARTVEHAGGALVIPDSALDGEEFVQAIETLVTDAAVRERMACASAGLGRRDAAARVVEMIAEAAGTGREHR
jgi:UDP-N-acetylglucosamine--N-acetylmuramyl-(pentapeptide) pyrophosphoryl-undecaprenol N-acetylglucosamine transferase